MILWEEKSYEFHDVLCVVDTTFFYAMNRERQHVMTSSSLHEQLCPHPIHYIEQFLGHCSVYETIAPRLMNNAKYRSIIEICGALSIVGCQKKIN